MTEKKSKRNEKMEVVKAVSEKKNSKRKIKDHNEMKTETQWRRNGGGGGWRLI